MAKFRFQDLKIWQLSIEIADELFDIADELEQKKLYRFAEQLRGSGFRGSAFRVQGTGEKTEDGRRGDPSGIEKSRAFHGASKG